MKILLIGEYSNVHNTLAEGLRMLGHEVTVASNGDYWKNYPRDIDLARRGGKLGGLALLAKVYKWLPKWRNYDVVQLINPVFLDLKAERLFPIYRYLKKHNKRLVLGAMGIDWYWVHGGTFRKPLRYSDFNMGDTNRTDDAAKREQDDWLNTAKERLNRLIAEECDGIAAILYENYVYYEPYHSEKLQYIPLPIKFTGNTNPPCTNDSVSPIKVFIGISKGRSAYKGTDIMLKAAEAVKQKYPDRIELLKAEGVPFDEYQHMMDSSDIIMDQLYSYTPAMNALLAMSKGIICMGGGEPEHYEFIGEKELRPVINVEPSFESVFHELEQLVLHPERIPVLKEQSVAYVRKHHDYLNVAKQYIEFYQSIKKESCPDR